MLGLDATEWASVPVLLEEVGIWRTLKLGITLQKKQKRGEPFGDLPPPEDEKERLSREQIGPAILLYRELCEFLEPSEALRVTRRVVIEAAVVFLGQCVGSLRREELEQLDDEQRRAFVTERGEKFFNADVRWDRIDPDRVDFTVTHCRFPPLCEAVGVPQLAPLFCAGDGKFFGGVEPNVELVRPHTIAEGAETCPFSIRWADD